MWLRCSKFEAEFANCNLAESSKEKSLLTVDAAFLLQYNGAFLATATIRSGDSAGNRIESSAGVLALRGRSASPAVACH